MWTDNIFTTIIDDNLKFVRRGRSFSLVQVRETSTPDFHQLFGPAVLFSFIYSEKKSNCSLFVSSMCQRTPLLTPVVFFSILPVRNSK